MLLDGITDAAAGVAESVNNLDAGNRILNNILGFVGYRNEIPRLCIPTNADPRRCNGGPLTPGETFKLLQCQHSLGGLDKMCAWKRVQTICTNDAMLDQWNDLFFTGDQISGLEREFVAAFGASFDETDPALVSLLAQVERGAPSVNLEARKAICDSAAFASSMTLDMIIQSCAFAAFGQHCPANVEVSREFEFLVDSTTFELPNVRFNYEVSPPPPPPVLLGATAALSLLDEEGFDKARSTVDSLLPTLQHTASSSVGGAVGEFLADEVVSQEQLTRAYLASYTYEKDSLAQRWVAAEHTGVWRKACASIVTLLLNNEELHSNQDGLEYDRNMLAYVTAEAALALNMNDVSVLNMWKLLCSHGGYRVPTDRSNYATYGYPAGTQVHNFLPIVGYGSLHALRSQRLAADVCGPTFDRDMISGISCGRVAGVSASRFFQSEQAQRAHFSPASMHKRYCDAMQTISVEDALSTPRLMTGILTDSSANRRDGIDDLVVSRLQRGQEDISSSYEELSLRGLVYVTYSHETRIRPGLHRLVDLQVFPSQGCAELPDARCSLVRTLSENPVDTATAFETGADMLLHTRCRTSMNAAVGVTCPHAPYTGLTGCGDNDLLLSSNPQLYGTSYWYPMLVRPAPPPPPTSYTGPAYEYTLVAQDDRGAGSPNLNNQPWAATMGGCRNCADHQHAAECSTVAGALEACQMLCNFHDGECVGIYFYGSGHPSQPMGRCCPLGQMPSFPGVADTSVFFYSKGPSSASPSPPPHGPPSPPPTETYTEMLERMRDAQELFCTSFNFQTTSDRCDQLAVSLGLRVRLLHSPPPSLPPPGSPQLIPPPPSTPPSPSLPRGTQLAPLTGATLSTLRMPTVDPAASLELLEDGFAVEEADEVAFANLAFHQRARCTLELDAVDALPCVSSVQEDNCISSGRHWHPGAEWKQS